MEDKRSIISSPSPSSILHPRSFYMLHADTRKNHCFRSRRPRGSPGYGGLHRTAVGYSDLLRLRRPRVFLTHRRKAQTSIATTTQATSEHRRKFAGVVTYRSLRRGLAEVGLHPRIGQGQNIAHRPETPKSRKPSSLEVPPVSLNGDRPATNDRH